VVVLVGLLLVVAAALVVRRRNKHRRLEEEDDDVPSKAAGGGGAGPGGVATGAGWHKLATNDSSSGDGSGGGARALGSPLLAASPTTGDGGGVPVGVGAGQAPGAAGGGGGAGTVVGRRASQGAAPTPAKGLPSRLASDGVYVSSHREDHVALGSDDDSGDSGSEDREVGGGKPPYTSLKSSPHPRTQRPLRRCPALFAERLPLTCSRVTGC
jgi:hypothetical protein